MADQDFQIKVITTADTTGIRQTATELDALANRARTGIGPDAATLAARQAALRSALTPVPAELQGAAAATEKVAEEMEKVGAASLFAGVNIARARQEATFLVRELATGVPTTRTLSSLLGAMGPYIAGAVGAGFALNRGLVANAERQLKINQELDEQLTKVTDLAQKWTSVAHAVTAPEDLVRLTGQIIPTLDAAQKKFLEFQNAGVSDPFGLKALLDTLTAGIPGVGKIFEESFQRQAGVLAENVQRLRDAASAAAKVAEEEGKAFEKRKLEDYSTAISGLINKIKDLQATQKAVGTENIESYNAIGQRIANATNQLNLLIKAHEAEAKAARESAAPLAKTLTTPTDKFIEDQRKAAQEHEVQRAALEQKRREAVAVGDTERAQTIEEELKGDKFARDQRKEGLQRYIANQESIGAGVKSEADAIKSVGPEGLRKFRSAQEELGRIYQQEKKERQPGSSEIGSTKNIELLLNQLLLLWR